MTDTQTDGWMDKGWSKKKNSTKLRLWLNKGGGSASGESFYMKKNIVD